MADQEPIDELIQCSSFRHAGRPSLSERTSDEEARRIVEWVRDPSEDPPDPDRPARRFMPMPLIGTEWAESAGVGDR
jgi:hypothetical protein